MNQVIQNRFKHRLLELREELEGEISQLSDGILMGALAIGEHDGCVSESIDKELALEHAEEGICQAVTNALTRLADGTFGHCVECGKEITARRMEALPYTAYCIRCEHRRENERNEAQVTRAIVARPFVHRSKRSPGRKAGRGRKHELVS